MLRSLLQMIVLVLPALEVAAAQEEANEAARAAAKAERQAAVEAERQAWLNQQPGLHPDPLPVVPQTHIQQREFTIGRAETDIYHRLHEADLLAKVADSAAFRSLVGEDVDVQAALRPRAREVIAEIARKAALVQVLRELNESEGADAPNPSPNTPTDEGGTPAAV